MEIRAHMVSAGKAEGEAVVYNGPFAFLDELVIVDAKVVTAFNETHMAQMLGYLNITGLDLALLMNFK